MNSIRNLRAKSDLYRELAGQMSDPWAGKSLREAAEAYDREADALDTETSEPRVTGQIDFRKFE